MVVKVCPLLSYLSVTSLNMSVQCPDRSSLAQAHLSRQRKVRFNIIEAPSSDDVLTWPYGTLLL